MSVYAERMARMEAELEAVRDSFDEHKKETKEQFAEINGKLDNLLTLRDKGVGAFWLASTILGTGIAGAIFAFFGWSK